MLEIQLTGPQSRSDTELLLQHREMKIGDGALFQLTKGYAPEGVFLERRIPFDEHHVGLNFCLKGKQTFSLTGNYLPTHADGGKSKLLLLPNAGFTSQFEAQGEFSTASFLIPLRKYFAVLGSSVELMPATFLKAAEYKNRCFARNYPWHSRIRAVIGQLMNEEYSPAAAGIFLESKLLEIIAILLDLEQQSHSSMHYLPKKDEEKIRFAKEILEKNLSAPPTLSKLSKMAGTNEFTLKKGFKSLFGRPVYQYLQLLRMQRAEDLLRDTRLPIGDIALEVGYESVSAFTRAFRQTRGYLPSDLRKTPFLHI